MSETTFRLARGVHVADLSGVREGYGAELTAAGHTVFTVNVSAERLWPVFRRLSAEVREPAFLLLEHGTDEAEERALRTAPDAPFHKDVHYLDGIDHARLLELVEPHAELFVNDGGVNFGYGAHGGTDEVFVGPYKLVYLYADDPAKYRAALAELGFEEARPLRTVWHSISPERPGIRRVLTEARPTIWDVRDELAAQGLYLAERRES
ncbi:MAG: hypothetical protein H6828_13210 [Planctomycetes bacterium]|nr:hypothetical protein [Planctomycetota bacterium]